MNPLFHRFLPFPAILLWSFPGLLSAQSGSYRGLWVGDVNLGAVNEVAIPLDEENEPRAPDPEVATPTFDAANLRLILHVDATGRVSLLKHVAVLSRKAGVQQTESDLALVTDERLYGAFPPQAATRISSVVFDFGDARATAAVDEVIARAADAARTAALSAGATQASVSAAALSAATPVVTDADAAAAFSAFLQNDLDKNDVIGLAGGGDFVPFEDKALQLRGDSFYGDGRGVAMVAAIKAAIQSATAGETQQLALNTAAAFAETDMAYDRFLAGELVGDMIAAAAESAALTVDGLALTPITGFLEADGGAAIAITSVAHGLADNEQIAIQGAAVAGYNGLHSIVRLDDDSFSVAVPFVPGAEIAGFSPSSQIAPLRVTSAAHGLTSGDRVTIRESLAGYNGKHFVTVIDADTFSIAIPFDEDPVERGVWSSRSGEIAGYVSTEDGTAPVKVMAPNHGLNNGQQIEILNSEKDSYNGLQTITRVDADSFTIDQAFDGNPAVKGTWDLPVAVSEFRPPAALPTLVSSPAHGLANGDRLLVSDSGKTEYNGEFVVTVVDADSFSIAVDFDAATGDPAVKGSWQPAVGGQWRKTAGIASALTGVAKVSAARSAAFGVGISDYDDTRAADAIEVVLAAIVRAAALAESSLRTEVTSIAARAGRDALASDVLRYPRPPAPPSTDYNDFVRSATFTDSVANAANAAAAGALKEKANLLASSSSILDKALQGAIEAMTPVFSAAARSLLTELPMDGGFGPGGSGLEAEIVLPANHPTNPFRHFRHPDHTVGYDIRRLVNLTFDAADAQPLAPAGYGVDRITGVYEEEIFGLHKPLGPAQDTGLKVRGTFQLNRISQIDTLNGR